jgi:hypothetical protein
MADYVNNLRLTEIATGDESGTWGTTTNTNLELIADAFGSGTEAITTNADTHTTTIANGAADEGRAIYLKYTGTLDSACTITLAPNTINKLWIIENATSGSQNIIISQGSGANITIGNGKVSAIFTDGAGNGAAVLDAFADLELSSTLTAAGNVTMSADASVGDDLSLVSDAAVLNFGADSDVNLTHVADTGLLLNSTMALQFNDASQYINAPSNAILDINATDEIELNATAVDLNGTLDVSGTSTLTGNVTMSADASVGDDLSLVSDAAVLNFGVDSDVNLTHVADTGLLMNSTMALQFNDASQYINAPSATVLDINATDEIELNATAVDLNGALDVSGVLTLADDLNVDSGILFVDVSNDVVGINTTTPLDSQYLHVIAGSGEGTLSPAAQSVATFQRNNSSGHSCYISLGAGSAEEGGYLVGDKDGMEVAGFKYNNSDDSMVFRVNSSNRVTIDSSGRVGIGTTAPSGYDSSADDLVIYNASAPGITLASGTSGVAVIHFADGTTGDNQYRGIIKYRHGSNNDMIFSADATVSLTLTSTGATVAGALSKGSGSFKIDHPLPSMKDTHSLVHSFIEGPRADLIYRGEATLIGGRSVVDLDEVIGMTSGTWSLLCRDPQVWVQNDSGWSAVRGHVHAGALTIECEDTSSTDTVSWMVVAERQDQHMIETPWTDDDGRPILEPEKPDDDDE